MERNQQERPTKVNKRALKTAIIISWIVLAVCFVIKLLGGNWFEIATNNGTFSKACVFVDNYLWLQNTLSFITNFLAVSLLNLAVLKQKMFKRKQIVVVFIFTAITFTITALGYCLNDKILSIIGFFASLLPFCICPMILSKKVLRSVLACVLYLTFQAISVVVKGFAITKIDTDSTLVALIYGIDLYIMLILYYLYANRTKDNAKDKINKKENSNG